MGIAERKEREKLKRIKDIVDAAEKVFFSKGYKNATMDEIAEEAELSKGTLYLYFKSKEMLHLEIIVRASKLLFKRFQEAVANEEKGIDKVRAIGDAYQKFCVEESEYFQAMMTFDHREISFDNLCDIPGSIKDSIDPQTILIDSIIKGMEDKSIRADIKPVETSMALWAFTNGIMQMTNMKREMIEKNYRLKVESIFEQANDLIYNSLKP